MQHVAFIPKKCFSFSVFEVKEITGLSGVIHSGLQLQCPSAHQRWFLLTLTSNFCSPLPSFSFLKLIEHVYCHGWRSDVRTLLLMGCSRRSRSRLGQNRLWKLWRLFLLNDCCVNFWKAASAS